MKSLVFSLLMILACALSANAAQTVPDDSARMESDRVADSIYAQRLHRYYRLWGRLVPRGGRMQFAGNMGLLSAGPVWIYGRRHWETAIMFGFVPKHNAHHGMATMTIKQDYIPWSIHLFDGQLDYQPLATGIYWNTVFSDKFWMHQPRKYPTGYYWFATRLRTSAYIGQRAKWNIPKRYHTFMRSVSLFWEVSTCDYYMIQKVENPRYMTPDRWLCLSFGLQVEWM